MQKQATVSRLVLISSYLQEMWMQVMSAKAKEENEIAQKGIRED